MGEKMERHTPGEWYATTRRGSWDWLVAIEGTNLEVCQCFHDGTEMNETGEANARLIAASPDLLEALKPLATLADVFDSPGRTTPNTGEIYTWSRMVDGEPKDFTLTVEMLRAARAAISKATTQERDRS